MTPLCPIQSTEDEIEIHEVMISIDHHHGRSRESDDDDDDEFYDYISAKMTDHLTY